MSKSLHDNIEVIESGYEYLLAYAAQGRDTDQGPGGSEARTTLTGMLEAAGNISNDLSGDKSDFSPIGTDDARKAGAAIAWVLAQ